MTFSSASQWGVTHRAQVCALDLPQHSCITEPQHKLRCWGTRGRCSSCSHHPRDLPGHTGMPRSGSRGFAACSLRFSCQIPPKPSFRKFNPVLSAAFSSLFLSSPVKHFWPEAGVLLEVSACCLWFAANLSSRAWRGFYNFLLLAHPRKAAHKLMPFICAAWVYEMSPNQEITNDVEDFFAANSLLMLEKCLSVALLIVGMFYSGGIFA